MSDPVPIYKPLITASKYFMRRALTSLIRIYALLSGKPSQGTMTATPRRILVMMGAHIGDAVIATSLIPVLRSAYPDVQIGFAVGSWSQMVVQGHPEVMFIHTLDYWRLNRSKTGFLKKWWRYRCTRRKALREIREVGYDVAICAFPWIPDFLDVAWAARIPVRSGFSKSVFVSLATHAVDYPSSPFVTQGACLAELLRAIGIGETHLSRRRSLLAPDVPEAVVEVCKLLSVKSLNGVRYQVVHVGSGAPKRELPTATWRELAMLNKDHTLVFTGRGQREHQAILEITRGLSNCIDACDKLSWRGYVAAVRNAEKVYGVESMAGHVSAAVGTECVVVYSGTAGVARWRPDGKLVTVITNHVPCAPCFLAEGCAAMTCMKDINARQITAPARHDEANREL